MSDEESESATPRGPQITPEGPGVGEILYRIHDHEPAPKIVEVVQRLEDVDDGHREYVLADPTHTTRDQYREEDLWDCFWTTGIVNDEPKPVMDDDVRALYQRVCDHSFSEVHDKETLEPVAEQCIHCRKRRELTDA